MQGIRYLDILHVTGCLRPRKLSLPSKLNTMYLGLSKKLMTPSLAYADRPQNRIHLRRVQQHELLIQIIVDRLDSYHHRRHYYYPHQIDKGRNRKSDL